jgi:hypothetical protein
MSESTDSAESAPDLELTKRRIAIGLDVERSWAATAAAPSSSSRSRKSTRS